MFGVTILGSNSAVPAYNRHPTAQVVTVNNQLILIDCGEGTQTQMMRYKIKMHKINYVFISHLHGDHYFGLIGILTSMGLTKREKPLHIYAPALLQDIINLQLKAASTTLPYVIHFHAITTAQNLVIEKNFTVACFEVYHRVPCWGFLITENKQPRKIDKEKVLAEAIPYAYFEQLKNGLDYEKKDGTIVKNEMVTIPNLPPKNYAYTADTLYDERVANSVKNVHLLYHETTYLHELQDRANARFHSTTIEAATIANKASAKKLLIGHFSSKYENLYPFLQETKTVFNQTELAIEGVTYIIP